MDPEEIADELYGLDPNDFVAVRDERVAQAREAGDRAAASTIGTLRKPTVAAWLVNALARERTDELAALLDLGSALRTAQRRLSGNELRTLSAQRRRAVGALEREAGRLAVARGRRASDAALREVGQTLNAALADDDIGQRVRAGRLEHCVEYSGFGGSGESGLGAVPDPPTEPADVAAQERAIADAEGAGVAAAQARDAAERAERELAVHDGRVRDLREQLAQVEQQREFARSAAAAAAQDRAAAERSLTAANAAVARLRAEHNSD